MRSLLAGSAGRARKTAVPAVQNLVRAPRTTLNLFNRTQQLATDGPKRYEGDSTLYPITSSLAQDTGNVKFRLYTPAASGKDEDREEVLEGQHPAVDLFLYPNDFYSRSELVESGQLWIDLVGEEIILVEWVGSLPVRLWPMDPTKFEPVTAPIIHQRKGTQFLLGWVYTADDGERIPLSTKEVLQIKLPNPNDPYRGVGPAKAALVDMDSGRFSAEWNRNFFLNGALPEGVVQLEDSFSDDEFTEFTQRWRESHQGLGNAHRVAVLENNAQWVPNQNTHRDMQFSDLRTQSSNFTRQAYRYPATLLGNTETANRAVAEAGEYVYGKWLIEPRARRWAAMLNNRLMPLYGENSRKLTWDFDPVVASDDQAQAVTVNTRSTAASTLVLAGYDAADALATVGLPPMQWKQPVIMAPPGGVDDSPDSSRSTGGSRGDSTKRAQPAKPSGRP